MDLELPEPDVIFDGVPYLQSLDDPLDRHDLYDALEVRARNYEPGTFANALSTAAQRNNYMQTERVLADATRGGFDLSSAAASELTSAARGGRLNAVEALLEWALILPRPRLLLGPLPEAVGRALVLAAGRGDVAIVDTLLSLRLRLGLPLSAVEAAFAASEAGGHQGTTAMLQPLVNA